MSEQEDAVAPPDAPLVLPDMSPDDPEEPLWVTERLPQQLRDDWLAQFHATVPTNRHNTRSVPAASAASHGPPAAP